MNERTNKKGKYDWYIYILIYIYFSLLISLYMYRTYILICFLFFFYFFLFPVFFVCFLSKNMVPRIHHLSSASLLLHRRLAMSKQKNWRGYEKKKNEWTVPPNYVLFANVALPFLFCLPVDVDDVAVADVVALSMKKCSKHTKKGGQNKRTNQLAGSHKTQKMIGFGKGMY